MSLRAESLLLPGDLDTMSHRCARQAKSLTMCRQKLELPKAEDIRDRSARFAAREKPLRLESAASKNSSKEFSELLQSQIHKMERSDFDLDTCATLLRQCSFHKALEAGQQLHRYVSRTQPRHIFLNNLVVLMYGSCSRVQDARAVFDSIADRNAHSWNIMIAAYTQNGHLRQALDLYWEMDSELKRCSVTYCSALGVVSKLGAIAEGREIHRSISGTLFETFGGAGSVGIALVNMYGKCASPDEARLVFDKLTHRTNVCWNAMISAYAQNQRDSEAIQLYRDMDLEGLKATEITFVSVIDACNGKNRFLARQVHDRVQASGLLSDIIVTSALVNMYAKSGMIQDARRLFDGMQKRNCYTWSGMIAGYARNGHCRQALELFRRMDVKPNNVTLISVLDACAQIADSITGRIVEEMFVPDGRNSDVTFGNALINMYGKCGLWEEARRVFEKMEKKTIISWTSMIAVYAQNGLSKQALEMFQKMDEFELEPNPITIISALDACADGGALKEGRKIHRRLLEKKVKPDGVLGNAIVNMYGKCGSLREAWEVFGEMQERTVVSWTSILAAFAEQGDGGEAFWIHKQMCLEGISPDDVTFISLLFACSHAGKLERGIEVFQAMVADFGCVPEPEHFRCVIDLLARTGRLSEAEDLIRSMPFEEDLQSWSTLLSGCKLHSNEEFGKVAADKVVEISPGHSGGYLLLSQIHAAKVRRKQQQVMSKIAGRSRNELKIF